MTVLRPFEQTVSLYVRRTRNVFDLDFLSDLVPRNPFFLNIETDVRKHWKTSTYLPIQLLCNTMV